MAAVIVKNMSFKVGQTLTIVGKALPDASSFDLNLGPNETDIALHVNPRFNAHFDKNVVLCNSYQDGKWGEEQREGGFPFRQGEEFKIIVWFTPAGFQVPLSDGSLIQFPNRLGAEEYSFIGFRGDALLTSLEIK